MFNRGGIRRVWHFPCKFQQAMALVKCPCACRLRRLAQDDGRGRRVRHCSCKFPHKLAIVRSPVQPLVTLGLSDRSRCGAVLILRSLASFGPVRSLSLRRGAHFEIPLVTLGLSDRSRCGAVLIFLVKEIFYRDLDKEVSCRELAQRSCTETSCRDLVQRSCQEISYRDLAKRACIESLYRDLFENLAKRPLLELYTDLARPPLLEILCRDTA